MPYTEPTVAQVDKICTKHRLGRPLIRRIPSTGVINSVYAVGDRLIMRVPRNADEGIKDTRTESVAAPVARRAGVRTPELVVFDDDRDVLDVPFTIYARVEGQSLHHGDGHDWSEVYRALGADLAILHAAVETCADPNGWLDVPRRIDALRLLETARRRNVIDERAHRWLGAWFEDLAPVMDCARSFRRFLHDDTQPPNVMHHCGRYAALIDWGDAGWGDPAFEFRHMPLRAVPSVLTGYRSVMPLDGDESAQARILWDHLAWALLRLTEMPGSQPSDWGATNAGRLLEILAFAISDAGWRWHRPGA